MRSTTIEDYTYKLFIEKKIIAQLLVGQRFAVVRSFDTRHKLKISELAEGVVVNGLVTNITPFGVFVNINAVCDGLIHISQLADGYIEHPDQVVSLGDEVSVRILKVDSKKRRISLSMKGLQQKSVKVKPSQNQLSSLANHFKNR
ncbi:MAG: S1 RNA-binding domain-containing protein [Chitinivibrionales bacterium]|nr:S1 RNA-binding domain-containing protein [Chitinivibrionales bacterium]